MFDSFKGCWTWFWHKLSSVWFFLGLLLSLVKAHLIGKDPDAGRDWEQEEKGTTEAEMAGWHHRLD